jgi:glycosyltransferase involved in cell wall biosynthesis
MTKGIEIVNRTLRIAQVAPPFERVPPHAYGGTERVVDELVRELHRRGHHVTTFASGDSIVPGERVVTVPEALRPLGYAGDSLPYMHITMQQVLARASEFDVIHAHLEWASLLLARVSPVPVVTTFHGRLDLPWAEALLTDPPGGLVAISQNQASTHPDVPWAAVVYNGLTLGGAPTGRRRGDGLVFVGRITPEKGIVEAIEIATRTGRPLKIAAKAGPSAKEREYHDDVFLPALKAAGSLAEYVGEIAGPERDLLFAESYATLMPGSWPEPFGLVAIESLACGTPVVARRIGALPEVLREGIDGFFGDDVTGMAFVVDRVAELDRDAIRTSVVERFSAQRMTDGYEGVYRRMIAGGSNDADDRQDGGTAPDDDASERELASPDRLADHRPDRLEALTGGR